jgi:GTP-binding protein
VVGSDLVSRETRGMSTPLKMEFLTSAAELHQLPATDVEIAVVGRSNVGKSSLLNALASRKNLAKVSSKPGRTQLLNCFSAGEGATVVDLPGYGYASTASKRTRGAWHRRMERYLLERDELALVFLLIDGEIGPTKLDLEMLAWLRSYGVPFQLVATKHDKVKSSARQRRKRELAEGCGVESGDVIWVSAAKGVGVDRLREAVRAVLDIG